MNPNIHDPVFPIFAYGLDYIVDVWRISHLKYDKKSWDNNLILHLDLFIQFVIPATMGDIIRKRLYIGAS